MYRRCTTVQWTPQRMSVNELTTVFLADWHALAAAVAVNGEKIVQVMCVRDMYKLCERPSLHTENWAIACAMRIFQYSTQFAQSIVLANLPSLMVFFFEDALFLGVLLLCCMAHASRDRYNFKIYRFQCLA